MAGPSNSRDLLFGKNGKGLGNMGTTGWSIEDDSPEPEDTRHFSVSQIRQHQYRLIEDQDRDLEALSEVITRQKSVAKTIGNEVDYQNDLIEDITDHVDRTRDRIATESGRITSIDRRDSTCKYWTVIFILFLIIILIVAIF